MIILKKINKKNFYYIFNFHIWKNSHLLNNKMLYIYLAFGAFTPSYSA